ncbi:MAG: HAMP domain-containing histidine kinase [Algoriphagus sp.]|nr:HAMP domain-containing histidine kinase [Algoriphagus sp.]
MKNPFKSQEDPGNLEQLQRRIALIFVGLTFFSMTFFGVADYLMGLSPGLLKIRIAYILLFVASFILIIKYDKYLLAMNIMLALILGFTIMNYLHNDGFKGPTIFNLYVFIVAVAIFFKKPLNLIWFTLSIGLYLVVFYLESVGQIVVEKNYADLKDLFLDNMLTILITSIFIFIGVRIVVINYQKQNQALIKLKEANDRNLRELQSLNEKKNQLIALLSHDLKNPVASLASTLQLVDLELISKEELGQILDKLKKQSVHLSHVLSNTLGWVVTEMGDHSPEPVMINVYELTSETQELMGVQAGRKHQKLEKVIETTDLVLPIQKDEVKIILRNYLDNAVKFSPEGATIYLEFQFDGKSFRWNVKNPGKEISAEVQNQLFDFNVKSSMGTQKEKGTGLGLGLCKQIAKKIGFNVGYERSADGFNVFYLEKALPTELN